MISIRVVASGSSGNFCIVGGNTAIDMGVPYKMFEPYKDEVKLVLLTHIHSDHFKASTIRRIAYEKPLIKFACGAFLAPALMDCGVRKDRIQILRPGMVYDFGICKVIPFELQHDVPNYGYKVHFDGGKVIYATDTRSMSGVVAKDYDWYLVEANYDDDEIWERMDAKAEVGVYAYERRVILNHLSKQKCDEWLERNMGPESQYIYMHRHGGMQ